MFNLDWFEKDILMFLYRNPKCLWKELQEFYALNSKGSNEKAGVYIGAGPSLYKKGWINANFDFDYNQTRYSLNIDTLEKMIFLQELKHEKAH